MSTKQSKASNGKPWALVTGASEGLGAEFARQIAQRKTHNIILTARTESKLQALAKELGAEVECKVIPADLSKPGSAEHLNEQTKAYDVAILVNNAGIAEGGPFEDMELSALQRLMSVNMVTFTELFYLFLPRVKQQHKRLSEEQKTSKSSLSGIINLSSTAATMPIPSMAAYAASKAYILSLSEAVYEEQRIEKCNVPICCCMPGPTKTEIWSKGGAHAKGVRMPMMSSEECVAITMRAFDSNRATIITGYLNNLMSFGAVRLTPRSLVRMIAYRAMGQDPALRDPDEVKKTWERLGRSMPERQKL